ncbi:MAG: hypothetical protein JWQ14_2428 [Adhaeribacter sp.]|jgi:hypothetical protein|nr:hypothetical protein [Adhaeribacter sp.]
MFCSLIMGVQLYPFYNQATVKAHVLHTGQLQAGILLPTPVWR